MSGKSGSALEISKIKTAFAGLMASLQVPGGREREAAIAGELASLSRNLPLFAVVVYRSSLRFKFKGAIEARELTSFISHASEKIELAYRAQLWRREVEAVIRADLGGEPELISRFSRDRQELKDMLLLLIRVILLEGSGDRVLLDQLPALVCAASADILLNPSEVCMVISSIFAARSVTLAELAGAMESIDLAMI